MFPALTRTKTEAQQLAAEIFPGDKAALARLPAGTAYPRYHLTRTTAETLRAIFFWLHEQKPTIYKRARWHLFYALAQRAAAQLDENAMSKVRDLYVESWAAERHQHYLAQIRTGDGDGI